MMIDQALTTKDLAVGYNGQVLIRDININLQRGRILTLIGPNGSGKTTILKTLVRLLDSLNGTICIGSRSIKEMSGNELSRSASVVLTEPMKTEMMNCREVVESGRYPYTGMLGILSAEDRAQVQKALELVHVDKIQEQDFAKISDGQRQRVLLARAICRQPKLIVLDEPTSFLDIRYELDFLNSLREMAKTQGIAVIMSLQQVDLAQRISDDVLCIKNGTVRHYGTAEEIFHKDLIEDLYDLTSGSYNPLFGSLELSAPVGTPKTFVIAGGGSGINLYRRLRNEGTPFVTGVLHENDVDYQVAQALASQVVSEKSFSPISDQVFEQASELLDFCDTVINCLTEYGETNQRNDALFERAKQLGKTTVQN